MYHIKCKVPMILEIDEPKYLESPLDEITLESLDAIIKCYPTSEEFGGSKTIPNIIKLSETVHNTSSTKVTKYPNSHIEILISPFTLSNSQVLDTQKATIQGSKDTINISITHATTSLVLKSGEDIFTTELPFPAKVSKAIKINGDYHILLTALDEKKDIYCKISSKKIEYREIKTMTEKDKKLTLVCPYNDMAKSAKCVTLTFSQSPSIEEKDVYIDNNPKLITDTRLVPYAFLEALQRKNFNLMNHYLGENIKSKLTNSQIESFFGDFCKIEQDVYNDKLCLIYDKNEYFEAKDYDFEVVNGKITNINEV